MCGWRYNERYVVMLMGGELPLGQKLLKAILGDEKGRAVEEEELEVGNSAVFEVVAVGCLAEGGLADGVELQNRVGWVSTRYLALLSPPILSVLYELVPQPNFLGLPCSSLLLLKLGSSATDGGTG